MPLPLIAVGAAAAVGGGAAMEALDRLRRGLGSGSDANSLQQHRARLVQFYQRHKPEKVEEVDNILEMFEGEYDDMWQSLYDKYGYDENGVPASVEDVLRGGDTSSGGVGGGASDDGGNGAGNAGTDAASSSAAVDAGRSDQRVRARSHGGRRRDRAERERERGGARGSGERRRRAEKASSSSSRRSSVRVESSGGRSRRRAGSTESRRARDSQRDSHSRSRSRRKHGKGRRGSTASSAKLRDGDDWSLDSDSGEEIFAALEPVERGGGRRGAARGAAAREQGSSTAELLGSDDDLFALGPAGDAGAVGGGGMHVTVADAGSGGDSRGGARSAVAAGAGAAEEFEEFDFEDFDDSAEEWTMYEDSAAAPAAEPGGVTQVAPGAAAAGAAGVPAQTPREVLATLKTSGALMRFVPREARYTEVYRGALTIEVAGSWLLYPLVVSGVNADGAPTELLRATVSHSFVPGYHADARFDATLGRGPSGAGGDGDAGGGSAGEDGGSAGAPREAALGRQLAFADDAGTRQQWRLEVGTVEHAEALGWCLAQLRAHTLIQRAPPTVPVVLSNLPPAHDEVETSKLAQPVCPGDHAGVHFTAWAAPEQGERGARARPDAWVSQPPVCTNVGGAVARVLVAEDGITGMGAGVGTGQDVGAGDSADGSVPGL
eukprot:g3999.t1